MSTKIYFSFPFKFETQAKNIINQINELIIKELQGSESWKFLIPESLDCLMHEYFYGDLKFLDSSDIFLIHLPEASIGASCELAIFKTKFPFKPAIGIKCCKHGWLERLLDYKFDNIESTAKCLSRLIENINSRTILDGRNVFLRGE